MFGLKIFANPLVREVRDEWTVEPMPIKKRRRNWRMVKRHIDRPSVIQMGDVFFAHPEIIEKLKQVHNEKN